MLGEVRWKDGWEKSEATVFLDGEAVELPSAYIVPMPAHTGGLFILRLQLSEGSPQKFLLVSDSLENLKLTANLWLMIDSQQIFLRLTDNGEEVNDKLFRDIEDFLGLNPNQNEGESSG